ncbi:hypothetical protein [Pseudoalteromonas umbrosa]|uniref:hypothetical protein n=1 Tax=Pseudoalteromonas umbrosa TaxID=3048489 RepID=UPI0024C238FD|nr:hypothetical protein [Pseudoalteromonas sp. B95]MDK1286340.1 hypothetical protein [Pseudoalteromonas sp. B95]
MIPRGFKLIDHLTAEQKQQYLAEKEAKKIEQANGQKVLRRFNKLVREYDFTRRSNWFSKQAGHVAHVIHFHKYTFGPTFRMHVLIRALNDSREHVALNGMPDIDLHPYESSFKYENTEESIQLCADAMFQAFLEVAMPWFKSNTLKILISEKSPLIESGREGLIEALNGKGNPEYVEISRKLLGLKV